MIQNLSDLKYYLECDRISLGMKAKSPKLFGDEIWKYEILLRKSEYWNNCQPVAFGPILKAVRLYYKYRLKKSAASLGFTIPLNTFGPGLAIVHPGTIVVAGNARIGYNCRIHEGVTIGATNRSDKAPQIGNNVFISSGAKIIGDIKISDRVAIGANAVVVKDVLSENGCTIGGVPAKIISLNDSSTNLIIQNY